MDGPEERAIHIPGAGKGLKDGAGPRKAFRRSHPNERMRAKTPKFSLALRGVASWRDAAKKVEIPRQKVRSRDFDIFSKKKPVGGSFM